VSVEALSGDRYRVTWPGGEREIEGFEPARGFPHELADTAAPRGDQIFPGGDDE
jgi:hypothetical protein